MVLAVKQISMLLDDLCLGKFHFESATVFIVAAGYSPDYEDLFSDYDKKIERLAKY